MPSSVDVAGELRRLVAAYAAVLPERAVELESALARWLDNGAADAAETLHRLAHGLTGAGAMYGMFDLSVLGRELTQQLELLRGRTTLAPEARASVQGLALQLTAAMRHASSAVASARGALHTQAPSAGGRRVLIVGGPEVGRGSLELMLSAAGYHVTNAALEPDAVFGPLVEAHGPDVLLVEHALATSARGRAELGAAVDAADVRFGVFGTDGTFLERLQAARVGAEIVLVPPYDSSGVTELDALLGLESAPPGRVLIVEDDALTARAYAGVLEDDGLITEVVTDPFAVLEALDTFRPNLVLLDLNMPGVSGIEITRVLRQRPDLVSTSIVFLSGETSWDLQQEAMRAGADDFLLKPVESSRLTLAVQSRVRRIARLDQRISRDSLTELMNQGTFRDRVQIEAARALREGKPLALALFDLDHFKAVNDTHGHPAGDRVLRALAHLLRDTLRQTDIIARCGGEEFGALLPGADEQASRTIMDGIRRAFNDLTHSSTFGEFRVALSCGIAAMPPAPDGTTLVDWADRALYRAKSSGRNQVALLPESERRATGAAATPERRRAVRRASSATARAVRSR